jgi:glutamate racemase
MNKPIGIFDSGIGGLTVMKELIRRLPFEDVIYFGDTARVPYGIKSKETVVRFSVENVLFLMDLNVKLIIVACNTSSSLALSKLKRNFKVPIIGVITPGVQAAVESTRSGRIGVIGTAATIGSGVYEKEIKRRNPKLKVFSKFCPLFVPLAEEGWFKDKVAYEVAERYLSPLKKAKVDTLILGCTHYPLLKQVIRKVMGEHVRLVDSAKQVAIEAENILRSEGIGSSKKKKPNHKYYVTDKPDTFLRFSKWFLKVDSSKVKTVESK